MSDPTPAERAARLFPCEVAAIGGCTKVAGMQCRSCLSRPVVEREIREAVAAAAREILLAGFPHKTLDHAFYMKKRAEEIASGK